MSQFKTKIPVDVASVLEQLPARSHVNSVDFDGESVVVNWENDDYQTKFTFATDWQDLRGVPAGVVAARPAIGQVSRQETGLPSQARGPGREGGALTAKPDAAANVKSNPKSKK